MKSNYYHVEEYADNTFYVEDSEGGDSTGPFYSKAEAKAECAKRNAIAASGAGGFLTGRK